MTQPTATGKVIIFSAPSGAGKSTIIGRLLRDFPQLEFSISATSRAPRGKEVHGCEYYFLDHDDFLKRAGNGEFVEWEEVYAGTCYGTLRSELERIWSKGHVIVFDVDVKGGVNLKKIFGNRLYRYSSCPLPWRCCTNASWTAGPIRRK